MWRKQGGWMAAALCLAVSLTACAGGQNEAADLSSEIQTDPPSSEETEETALTSSEEEPSSSGLAAETEEDEAVPEYESTGIETQIKRIAAERTVWTAPEDEQKGGGFLYTVCDLNQNGRLEIIASSCQGTGLYTTSYYWEVNEAGDGLDAYEKATPEGSSEADIETSSAKAFYEEASGDYYYIFNDITRNGVLEQYYNKRAIQLKDGQIQETPLANMSVIYQEDSDEPEITCTDATGNFFTEEEYDQIEDRIYGDLTPCTLTLKWVSAADGAENPESQDGEIIMSSLDEGAVIGLLQEAWDGFRVTN